MTVTGVVNSLAGFALTQMRYSEEADLDAAGFTVLHVLLRAADNKSRELRMSQEEIARRTKLSAKTVWRKLALLEERGFILRESQPPTKFGRRSWDLLTMVELDHDGEPVSADSVSSGGAVSADSVTSGPPDSVSCSNGLGDDGSTEEEEPNGPPPSIPHHLLSAESPVNVFVARAAAREIEDRAPHSENGHGEIPPQENLLAPQDVPQELARPGARSARSNLPEEGPLDSVTADTASTNGNGTAHSEAEIRAVLAAVPWERIHEPADDLGLDLIDLDALGFEIMASGLLIDGPKWWPHPVNEINTFVADACRHG